MANHLCAHAPTTGRIVSGFGPRHRPARRNPWTGEHEPARTRMHNGIDIGGRRGDPVWAIQDGIVRHASNVNGIPGFSRYGRVVVLELPNARPEKSRSVLWALYAHLDEVLVERGQHVRMGQRIARKGRSAGSVAHPDTDFTTSNVHLHFELSRTAFPQRYDNGMKVDPRPWLKARGVQYGPHGELLRRRGCASASSSAATGLAIFLGAGALGLVLGKAVKRQRRRRRAIRGLRASLRREGFAVRS